MPAAHVIEFLNLDLLAAGLSPLRPEAMAVRSARLLLARWKELVKERRDFAFESTLSGRTYATMLRQAKDAGYEIRLCYLWLADVGMSLRRVKQRVKKGGHDVPEKDVRRRFRPSLTNFFALYLPIADFAILYNAAANPPRIIARWEGAECAILISESYERIQSQNKQGREKS